MLRALGYGIGMAMEHNPAYVRDFLETANAVNRNNPDWQPYQPPVDIGEWKILLQTPAKVPSVDALEEKR